MPKQYIGEPYAEKTIDVSFTKIFFYAVMAIVVIAVLVTVFDGFYIINAGERGVLLRWGEA